MTHLCFVDDLLILTEGKLEAVKNILLILNEFEQQSGLALNIQKTSFFSAGLSSEEITKLKEETSLIEGNLPVRYLGVPLCTKKITLLACALLLEAIKARFNSWASKALSFVGRLQLLNTVINGITSFWSNSFILPKACTNEINKLCGKFLWRGNIEERSNSRVSWDSVTKSKQEGGLGIRDSVWNTACILKFI